MSNAKLLRQSVPQFGVCALRRTVRRTTLITTLARWLEAATIAHEQPQDAVMALRRMLAEPMPEGAAR